jgi:thiol-disulfide isomerase/thioredoxin
MKKYLPILAFILVFTGLLGGQFVFDFLAAGPTTKEKSINAHYQSMYSKFQVKSVANKNFDLPKSKAPIVILNFWASWCVPCLVEFPSMVSLKNKFNDEEVLVLGINGDEEKPLMKIKKIQKKYGLNFPIIKDEEGKILNDFLVSSLPMSIIFFKGKVYKVTKGSMNFNSEELISKFKEIIKSTRKEKTKIVKEKSSLNLLNPLKFNG